jgi:hypothetical protein
MYKPFSVWLENHISEANLEMKQAINASFAAHLNATHIGLHNLKGTGVRRVQPDTRMGHKLSSDHLVVGKKGAYAIWDRDDNQWMPLPVNLMPAKEVLFGNMDRMTQPDSGVSEYDPFEPTSPSVNPRPGEDKRDYYNYDRLRGNFGS